jgi:glycosyltransferase involved in cell wall biosynthesis
MASTPFFSIVVPTFNSEAYLYQCLSSLAGQTLNDYEVIVVDKQSTDQTLGIVRSFNLPILTIISQSSASLPEALDEGFNISKGTLLCWLNSDDAYARPDALELIHKKYLKCANNSYCFVYASHLCINDDNLITSLSSSHWPTSRYERALGGLNLCTGAIFFSRKLFDSFGGFGARYKLSFEYRLIDFMFLHGSPLFVPVYIYAYRLHLNQLSRQSHDLMTFECSDISALLPSPSVVGFFIWLFKRALVRLLYSNPFQRTFWFGRTLLEYWEAHLN